MLSLKTRPSVEDECQEFGGQTVCHHLMGTTASTVQCSLYTRIIETTLFFYEAQLEVSLATLFLGFSADNTDRE